MKNNLFTVGALLIAFSCTLPVLADTCYDCSSPAYDDFEDLGSPMGSGGDCKRCYNVSGTSLTGNHTIKNWMSWGGYPSFLIYLTPDQSQTSQFITDCSTSGVASKCVGQDPPPPVMDAGTLCNNSDGSSCWSGAISYDQYGNRVFWYNWNFPFNATYYHFIKAARTGDFCQYPDPAIITTELPDPVWSTSFTTPSAPITEVNPIPSLVVSHPKQPEEMSCLSGAPDTCPPVEGSDPVDVFSGNYYFTDKDLIINGVMPITIGRRYYSGKNAFTGVFGIGSHLVSYNFQLTQVPVDAYGVVTLAPNQEVVLDVGNGETITFTNPDGTNKFINNGLLGTTGDYITLTLGTGNVYEGAVYHQLEGEMTRTFDEDSLQVSIADRNGNELVLTRNGSGQLTKVQDDASGRYVNLYYNGDGTIYRVQDNTGRQVNYSYVYGTQELEYVSYPHGYSMNYVWDTNHRITVKHDFKNNAAARNIYGSTGAVMTQIRDDNGYVELEYIDASTRQVTDTRGNVTTYTFNGNAALTSVEDPLGHATSIDYSTNFFNNNTTSRYYEVTDALSHTTRYDLNANNLITKVTDEESNETNITYNTSHPDRIATVTDPMSHVTTYSYDGNGNLSQVLDNDSNEINYTYNALGQVETIENQLNKTTTLAYDATSHDLESVTDPMSHVTEYETDALGRVTEITDPENNTTEFEYDSLDRLHVMTNADTIDTTYNYDANSNLTSVVDGRGKTYVYTYDSMNRLTSFRNPNYQTNDYYYDQADNLIQFRDAKYQDTYYTYDVANRLTKTHFYDNSEYNYTYNNVNQLASVTDGTDTWSWTYDDLNRVESAVAPEGTLDYEYNDDSLLTEVDSAAYGTVAYGYDTLDRLSTITKGGNTYTYGYNAASQRTSLTRPSGGINTTYTYGDNDLRLTAITHSQGMTPIESFAYSYDDNDNITSITQAGGNYGDIVRDYFYDSLNRLTKIEAMGILPGSSFANPTDEADAEQDIADAIATTNSATRKTKLTHAVGLGAVVPQSAEWTFADNSNIATRVDWNLSGGSDTTYTYTYDDSDHLTDIDDGTNNLDLTYDSNGSLTNDETYTYTWNARNQLVTMTDGTPTTFDYDPLGRRKKRNSTDFFYNGLDLIGDGTYKFLFGAGIDEPLQMSDGTTTLSYAQDQLGSTSRLVQTSNGALQSQYYYQAYGKYENNQTNPNTNNPFTYTGREDDGTGLYYYRARYYNPEWGVFISQDPLGDAQRYAVGNPLRYIDPFGLSSDCTEHGDGEPHLLCGGAGAASGFGPRGVSSTGELGGSNALRGVNYRGVNNSNPCPTTYENITNRGTLTPNRGTNLNPEQFGKNLENAGWSRGVSSDGKAVNYTKDGARYSVRPSKTGTPTADYYPPGQSRTLKIRLTP